MALLLPQPPKCWNWRRKPFSVRYYGIFCLSNSPAIYLRSYSDFFFFTNVHVKKLSYDLLQTYHPSLLIIACSFLFSAFLQSHPGAAKKTAPNDSPFLLSSHSFSSCSTLSHPWNSFTVYMAEWI